METQKKLHVLPSDRFFYDSPQGGHPDCLCSRCGEAIPEKDEPIIRAWPGPGDYGYDAKAKRKGGTEFRYCRPCCEKMGVGFVPDIEDLYETVSDDCEFKDCEFNPEPGDHEKLLREKGKCCVTDKPLRDSKFLTVVPLNFRASWDFPYIDVVLGEADHTAIAYVHDDAIVKGKLTGPVKYAIEEHDNEIIYHPIRRCRVCGCADYDCSQCIKKTGHPCSWVENDLCSACVVKE